MAAVYFSNKDQITRKVRALLVHHVAGRDPGSPFSKEICGALPKEMCGSALSIRIQEELGRSGLPLSALCVEDLDPLALGLSGWTEELRPIAGRVVSGICAPLQ